MVEVVIFRGNHDVSLLDLIMARMSAHVVFS